MIFMILKFFIVIFVIMVVVGLIRGKGRTRARGYETAREDRKVSEERMIAEKYEENPDESGITEDDYIYSCFVSDRDYKGYSLKNAHAFYTTCTLRNIRDEAGRKSILKYDELFGIENLDGFDTEEFYRLGERVSRFVSDRKRVEKAQKDANQ